MFIKVNANMSGRRKIWGSKRIRGSSSTHS